MKHGQHSRRDFLRWGLAFSATSPILLRSFGQGAAPPSKNQVAIVSCRSYEPAELKTAFARCFDLLGGIGGLVRNKTVTVKMNLTGTDFSNVMGRTVGETYMTHPATVQALVAQLFAAGAARVRLVESTNSKARLESTLALADWDLDALRAMGNVGFENTRNLGAGNRYAHLKVPGSGYMFSSFDFNHSYADTDVMVSLAKLKNHVTAGVTLTMKNLFGITPNALYGSEAGNEDATAGRGPLHNARGHEKVQLPGLKNVVLSDEGGTRVPRIVADICAARPIHLAIIDGITSVSGGEGPWTHQVAPLKFTTPGLLVAGLNPVCTDAVGTAIMGYDNPRAPRGTHLFEQCDNHLLLAEQAGVGAADLKQIEVRGLSIEKARYPYG